MAKDDKGASRRDFLKLASVSAPAAAVAVVAAPQAAEAASEQGGGDGLRDTPHTRAYFETARF
ncbi:twin-arginine translocation signal domain-containing protein [Rhodobacteraceae bacterium 2CG4]|uniref:Twin-arginine translocation signal domain-containing protein n=1 Tax=Halovulum marinum TaxID=2662447 RepID=A0A6L5Z271_9RHOB|nr:ubiquinol-cytochrome c reductase iron-sulfur subunit N-terminal domain-containing protein [Halovulum marinum]MSU90142.1 twin-arginine translocation signal domain-containing protein [Halovulum marinum]